MSKLEQVVSFMVNTSAANQGRKLSCWSDDSPFQCAKVNGRKWRETFHDLVAIARFDKPQRPKATREGETTTIVMTPAIHSLELEYSPVVSLCDILKLPPQEDAAQMDQQTFMDYFNLATSKSSATSTDNKYYTSHPRTLVNSPHIPFSSNIGLKLIKDWHSIPKETHIKKLERLERYISTVEQKPVNDIQYEVTFNKNVDNTHYYIFPTKKYHRPNKLTPKAKHLLHKYCRPCSVQLSKVVLTRPINTENPLQKENILYEPKIILTNYFPVVHKENSFEGPPAKLFKELRPRKNNVVLKTLTPRNQNSTTIVEKGPVMCENLMNASVVLSPINTFFGLSSKSKLKSKIKKIDRGRLHFCARRISPRLNIRNKPLTII